MSKLPSRRRIWAIAYGLTIVAAVPLLSIQQGWSSPVAGQREGVIHLKRGHEYVDVNSLLDTTQPDFFLRIEMDKPAAQPTPAVTPESPQEASPSLSSGPVLTPAVSSATASLPLPGTYEEHLLAEELAMMATPSAVPSEPPSEKPAEPMLAENAPVDMDGARMQAVADALYHAPRLAREGNYREALAVVDAALGIDDEVAPLHALRGSICYMLGRERQAEEGWARAVELDPRLTDARQALNWIRNRRR